MNLPQQRMIPHLPVQKVSLRHPHDRITNNTNRNIKRYSIEFEAERLISKNWNIPADVMPFIHWLAFHNTMNSYSRFHQFSISKFVHNQ